MNISHCPARFGGSACLLAKTFGAPLGDGYTNAASPPIFSIEQAAFSALQRARGSARSTLLNSLRVAHFSRSVIPGGVVEWFMAPVLKTGRPTSAPASITSHLSLFTAAPGRVTRQGQKRSSHSRAKAQLWIIPPFRHSIFDF